MPELSLLLIFIPTWLLVSISPGLCMSLAMTLGMTVGYKKTLWMMLGELIGVAVVGILSVIGVAQFILAYPDVFFYAKIVGGLYIVYVGVCTMKTPVQLAQYDLKQIKTITPLALFNNGFMTAILNPKGWAFMVSLLPPLFEPNKSLTLQLSVFISIILISEFISMSMYATGGKGLSHWLNKNDKVHYINRVDGTLLIAVGVWLAFS